MPFSSLFSTDTLTSDPDGAASISYLTIGPIVLGFRGSKREEPAPAELTADDLEFLEQARLAVHAVSLKGRRVTIGKAKTVWIISGDHGSTVTLTAVARDSDTTPARTRRDVAVDTLFDADTKLPIN
jgi:hypothetical protein